MGTSKHKQELLSLNFYYYLSISAIFARLYKVSQEERTCKLARGFTNQNPGCKERQGMLVRWYALYKHLRKVKGINHMFQEE